MKFANLETYLRQYASEEMKIDLAVHIDGNYLEHSKEVIIAYSSPFLHHISGIFNAAGIRRLIIVYDKTRDYQQQSSQWGEGVLIEEFIHLRQQAKDGLVWWIIRYAWQAIFKGYEKIDYEVKAREAVKKYFDAVNERRSQII